MPRRNRHQDLDFEIHVDPSCLSEPTGGKLPSMEHEDAATMEESFARDHVDGEDMKQTEDSVLDARSLQPTVEEVDDDPTDDSATLENAWADEHGAESRRQSARSNASGDIKRWPSMRTEAMINAAARDIVDQIASRPPRGSMESAGSFHEEEEEEEEGTSFAAGSYTESHRPSVGGESEAGHSHASEENHSRHTAPADECGDSSSHHEHEDDVFSDNSPRSSMGSMSEAEHRNCNKISPQKMRAARISDIPQSDADEEFVPTKRITPRPTFRSPSSVKAMQMSSPPASVSGTPRSSRRTPRPTVSRLGSPSASAQYSPKKTPPRFKRNTPPLVLLHVTVLPSRWAWGHVLDSVQPSELSPEGKTLWETWNQLQDRTGDTISDRGILLPHPQNDYEVLEERLLETLELPVRRRARILECGHFLGPSNEMAVPGEAESDEDEDGEYYDDDNRSPRQSLAEQTHWCKTCCSDIRFDSLGDSKVYRVKVYASNGLMRAGAWEACWKEMERVDVELEPVVDSKLQEELSRLATEQERALELEEEAADAAAAAVDEEIRRREEAERAEQSYMQEHVDESVHMGSPADQEIPVESSPQYDDRQARDAERLREIYGQSPPPHPESSPAPEPKRSDFDQRETPASPSVEAFERREERRENRQQVQQTASLPELIFEAIKVLMQDQKNVLIGLLSLVVLMLAVRGASAPDQVGLQTMPEPIPQVQVAVQKPVEAVTEVLAETMSAVQSKTAQVIELGDEPASASMELIPEPLLTEGSDPCIPCSRALQSVEVEQLVAPTSTVEVPVEVEVVKTVTETMVETVTIEVSPTDTASVAAEMEEHTELDGVADGQVEDGVLKGEGESESEGESEVASESDANRDDEAADIGAKED